MEGCESIISDLHREQYNTLVVWCWTVDRRAFPRTLSEKMACVRLSINSSSVEFSGADARAMFSHISSIFCITSAAVFKFASLVAAFDCAPVPHIMLTSV